MIEILFAEIGPYPIPYEGSDFFEIAPELKQKHSVATNACKIRESRYCAHNELQQTAARHLGSLNG